MRQTDHKSEHTSEFVKMIEDMLHRNEVQEIGSGVVEKLLCVVYKHTIKVLDEAKIYMENDKRAMINASDIKLVLELMKADQHTLNQKDILELVNKCNEKSIPEIKQLCGLALPQTEYCLNKPNYKLKSSHEHRNINVMDVAKHQIFSPVNIRFPNINLNIKNRMSFPQQPTYALPIPNSIFHFNTSIGNNFPMVPMQKQKVPQIVPQAQKITVKPKINVRANIENINIINMEPKKEVIKRPVCTEPQKIVFKPKLLLSLNTNTIDNVPNNTKSSLENKEETSPTKRKRFQIN